MLRAPARIRPLVVDLLEDLLGFIALADHLVGDHAVKALVVEFAFAYTSLLCDLRTLPCGAEYLLVMVKSSQPSSPAALSSASSSILLGR